MRKRQITLFVCTAIFCLLFMAVGGAFASPTDRDNQNIYSGNVYVGNVKTLKYHNSGCRYFTCKSCTARFASPQEAKAKGFTACKVCGG